MYCWNLCQHLKHHMFEMKEEIGQGSNLTFMNMSTSCSGVMLALLSLFISSANKSEHRARIQVCLA